MPIVASIPTPYRDLPCSIPGCRKIATHEVTTDRGTTWMRCQAHAPAPLDTQTPNTEGAN